MTSFALAMIDASRGGTIGLTLFLLIFAGVVIYALTRSRSEVDHWSALPLETTRRDATQSSAGTKEADL